MRSSIQRPFHLLSTTISRLLLGFVPWELATPQTKNSSGLLFFFLTLFWETQEVRALKNAGLFQAPPEAGLFHLPPPKDRSFPPTPLQKAGLFQPPSRRQVSTNPTFPSRRQVFTNPLELPITPSFQISVKPKARYSPTSLCFNIWTLGRANALC